VFVSYILDFPVVLDGQFSIQVNNLQSVARKRHICDSLTGFICVTVPISTFVNTSTLLHTIIFIANLQNKPTGKQYCEFLFADVGS
jgi:hypothetical protein